jgi:hypothetical protein
VEEFTLRGLYLILEMAASEEVQIINHLRAPNVRTLNVIFSVCVCPSNQEHLSTTPARCHTTSTKRPGRTAFFFDTESWKFLPELRVLRLCWYLEPLYNYKFISLKILYLLIGENALPVPTELPELAEHIVRI